VLPDRLTTYPTTHGPVQVWVNDGGFFLIEDGLGVCAWGYVGYVRTDATAALDALADRLGVPAAQADTAAFLTALSGDIRDGVRLLTEASTRVLVPA
jgi:hypothetical protein